ncbi:hypothetical protein [Calothrix sp. PCC 6303]|uniref:hypothetical protein n=1 Tax=Calothrix sp. PCC 6303 TaxID=1170562 RepID=UPI0002A02CD0|nr:hypothetical protein [Calothrix sp. PCC 6303]AFZ00219.1 hypothetical protein Cal6303_1158 [Calothrix sp. PCC 6303]
MSRDVALLRLYIIFRCYIWQFSEQANFQSLGLIDHNYQNLSYDILKSLSNILNL